MFSNTAYESLYTYIGLSLHSKFIDVITSHGFFTMLVLIIFGSIFFVTILQFFSRYMPGTLVKKRSVPLSKFFQITACLFLGISLLRVGSKMDVRNFSGDSWHTNPYITQKIGGLPDQQRVSFLFDLLSRSADELSRFMAGIVDGLFKKTHSQLEAPDLFYKAIMYAGTETIDDPELGDRVSFYTEHCFDKMLPIIGSEYKADRLDGFFRTDSTIDRELKDIPVSFEGRDSTCYDVKNVVRDHLHNFAATKSSTINGIIDGHILPSSGTLEKNLNLNLHASHALVNHFMGQKEAPLGIMKGSQVPAAGGRILQYMHRIFSVDGFLSLVSNNRLHGAALTAKRSQEFSENLQRAPHIAGFTKMVLIFIFPWLIFFVVAGRWKVLVYWYALYFSVALWAPIWTLFYHIVNSIALSAETMEAFGHLSDGVSLVGAEMISSRMYQMFAVYSWIQLLIGPAPTMLLAWQLSPLLRDTESDNTSEALEGISSMGSVASAGLGGGGVAKTAARVTASL
ncbi:MAG: hypothetical protein AB7F43_06940 [Bacteriovoracia bacterium]